MATTWLTLFTIELARANGRIAGVSVMAPEGSTNFTVGTTVGYAKETTVVTDQGRSSTFDYDEVTTRLGGWSTTLAAKVNLDEVGPALDSCNAFIADAQKAATESQKSA